MLYFCPFPLFLRCMPCREALIGGYQELTINSWPSRRLVIAYREFCELVTVGAVVFYNFNSSHRLITPLTIFMPSRLLSKTECSGTWEHCTENRVEWTLRTLYRQQRVLQNASHFPLRWLPIMRHSPFLAKRRWYLMLLEQMNCRILLLQKGSPLCIACEGAHAAH